jgi:hypothetical protein
MTSPRQAGQPPSSLPADLGEIFGRLDSFEAELERAVLSEVLHYAEERGCGLAADNVIRWSDGLLLQIGASSALGRRELQISFVPRGVQVRSRLVESVREVNACGRIREIKIVWPANVRRKLERSLPGRLVDYVRAQYFELEKHFTFYVLSDRCKHLHAT